MAPRSNGNASVSSTDVLIAMLSGDLRGSHGEAREPVRTRAHGEPAASPTPTPTPPTVEAGEPEAPAR